MVAAGVCFGVAATRAGVVPRWTGACLVVGVVLVAVASGLPDGAQTAAAAVRDVAFAGMGVSLLRRPLASRAASPVRGFPGGGSAVPPDVAPPVPA